MPVADRSAIEWTQATWNPTTGCDRISTGCDNCYAMTLAKRLKAMGSPKYQHDGDPRTSGPGFAVTAHPDTLQIPLRWHRPQTVFVNSMSDLFHARVPLAFIRQVFDIMTATPRHTYQILTKRAARLAKLAPQLDWPANVWMGTSVETADHLDRLDHLRQVPAAVRFVSAEPLLGPLDDMDLSGIGWVIVGGESGPNARPMHPDWARSIRDQCQDSGVAFFFKQWGEWRPNGKRGIGIAQHVHGREALVGPPLDDMGHREVIARVGKKAAGRELDGRIWDQTPAGTRLRAGGSR
jgi:protein gp37